MSFQRRQLLQILSSAFGFGVIPFSNTLAAAGQNSPQPSSPDASTAQHEAGIEKVAGIGGFFFRAHDPAALAQWYQQHLGIALTPTSYGAPVWQQEAGRTVVTPFPETTKYFGNSDKVWMLNFRVHDLEKMADQLRNAGIDVKIYPPDPNGRFARIHDPEGNPIELWQPS